MGGPTQVPRVSRSHTLVIGTILLACVFICGCAATRSLSVSDKVTLSQVQTVLFINSGDQGPEDAGFDWSEPISQFLRESGKGVLIGTKEVTFGRWNEDLTIVIRPEVSHVAGEYYVTPGVSPIKWGSPVQIKSKVIVRHKTLGKLFRGEVRGSSGAKIKGSVEDYLPDWLIEVRAWEDFSKNLKLQLQGILEAVCQSNLFR